MKTGVARTGWAVKPEVWGSRSIPKHQDVDDTLQRCNSGCLVRLVQMYE